jgi:DNA topoisomerase-1
MGHDEGVRTMVARDLVKSGQAHVTEVAGTGKIVEFLVKKGFPQAVADHVGALHWRREQGPSYPGKDTWPESEVVERRPDTVLLEAAMRRNLGRPSTWATHIENFMGRDLVDAEMNLTDKGRKWIAGSPQALLDPRVSVAIENACEKVSEQMMETPGREPWEVLAERIVAALPEGIRAPLAASVASEAPKPRVDHLARFQETVGLEEALQRRAVRTFAPPQS